MGSQLNMQAACLKSDPDNYEYPLIHAGAAPTYTFPTDARPVKRVRLAKRTLPSVNTKLPTDSPQQEIASAQPSGSFPRCPRGEYGSSQETPPPSRSASVPPEQPKRGRKKRGNQPKQSDPFIMEHMPFPEHQPWLKVKPRQRKAAVAVDDALPTLPPASEAPDEGEDLVLAKHADRIAALIAQKRRENDSKQFRQRMALQQRLHRGEQDESDKAIAASHDELKRKMKLSAQGIFEERPPDGTELEFRTSDRSSVESVEDAAPEGFVAYRNACQDNTSSTDIQPSPGIDQSFDPHSLNASEHSDVDDELEEAEVVGRQYDSPPPILGPYVHYNQAAYYQQTILTNRLLAVSGTAPAAQAVESIYAPHHHPYPNQYPDNPPGWSSAQPWTTHQMYHALPSTQTPELERAEMARARQRTDAYDVLPRDNGVPLMRSQTHDNYDYYASATHSVSTTNTSSSSSTPAVGVARMNHQVTLPSSSTPAAETETPVLRSNVNIFTRQARENGVIGGNNNVVVPTTTRRNMFDRS